jgi:hypothetical protein
LVPTGAVFTLPDLAYPGYQTVQIKLILPGRKPAEDVSEAVAGVEFNPGERVICVEWYCDGPMPQPEWHRDVDRGLSEEENNSLQSDDQKPR